SPLCATAALETLRQLSDPTVIQRIEDTGRQVMETARKAAHDQGIPCSVQGVGAMFQTVFTPDGRPTRNYRDLLRVDQVRSHAFRHELLKRGVHANAFPMACWFVSAAVTDHDLAATCTAIEEAFKTL
ncbi:aspartate aminotransferase family protein, partial [Streptomyces sp. NPDC058548]